MDAAHRIMRKRSSKYLTPFGAPTVRGRPMRENPALMLVTGGNPPNEAALKEAWKRFHQRDTFDGRKVDVGRIPGTPPVTFAIGYLYALDFGSGDCVTPKKDRPWVCCNPEDQSLWIVSKGPMDFSKVAGRAIHALTYDPIPESGKDDAHWKHEFSTPRPTLSPVGTASKSGAKVARAALIDGGRYKVDDWLYD